MTASLLLITNRIEATPRGGRELLCKLNRDALSSLLGSRLAVFELDKRPVRSPREIVDAMRGYLDGVDARQIAQIISLVDGSEIVQLFIDGSNLGAVARAVKQTRPHVRIVTFFHNVEAAFFFAAFKRVPATRAAGVMLANYLAERSSVRWSDSLVCLSARDSRLLTRLYGRAANHIAPLCLSDSRQQRSLAVPPSDGYALFVGGTFFANVAGIRWFRDYVVPRIDRRVVVVGKGFEALRGELEGPRIQVVGAVDDLAHWYGGARVVIAPIFDGSGMKTKVAEALMHGRKIIGTPEAFSGYEDVASQAGWVCRDEADFVTAFLELDRANEQPELLRSLYEQHYSFEAARRRLANIIGEVVS